MLASIGRVLSEVVTRDVPEAVGLGQARAAAPWPYPLPKPTVGACTIRNPATINFFSVFDGIINTKWKGCVEARPAPYDVTDEPPRTTLPNSLFVPYFWVDDGDPIPSSLGASGWPAKTAKLYNDFISDNVPGGSTMASNYNGRTWSVYKYNNAAGKIDDDPPVTMGPNQACPTPILPLDKDKSKVLKAINDMRHWEGGGTNSGEGVMWGWRVLSPGQPFTEGGAYEATRKVMVLFGDGVNSAFPSDNPTLRSEMGAYNFQNAWISYASSSVPATALRLPISSTATYTTYLDARQRLACKNAKAAGVEIYTVLFRESSPTAKALYEECATDKSKAFTAKDQAELIRAFGDIADDIAKLRLTK